MQEGAASTGGVVEPATGAALPEGVEASAFALAAQPQDDCGGGSGGAGGSPNPACPTGNVIGTPCPVEGQACGAELCQINPCEFCNFLFCSNGVWRGIEVFPLPPDQCKSTKG